jgi:hypothetical protein
LINDIYQPLSRELNGGNTKQLVKTFMWFLTRDHRTLQQCFWKFIIDLIKAYSKLDIAMYTDGRNEQAMKACKMITEMVEKEGVYLPLI